MGPSSSSEAPLKVVMGASQVVPQILTRAPPDIVVLYHTLVADGGLLAGYGKIILYLGSSVGVSRTTTGQAISRNQQYPGVLFPQAVLRARRKARQGCKDISGPVSPRSRNSATEV